ncbi:hypothetical protein ACFL3K_00305 [Pseudomonadota bacterium]
MDKIDPRYNSYVQIYNNFDNVLWKIPTILLAGTAIMVALIGNIIGNFDSGDWFTSPLIIGIMLFGIMLFGGVFLMAGRSTKIINDHLDNLSKNLQAMEEQAMKENGFFHYRHSLSNDSFIRHSSIIFTAIGGILIFASILSVGIIWLTCQ